MHEGLMAVKYWPELIAMGSLFMLLVGSGLLPLERITRNPDLIQVHAIIKQIARGHLTGSYGGQANGATFTDIQLGDVILCHNRGGGYGYWTHAVLYVGHGSVIDANDFVHGTRTYPLQHYRNYDRVAVLRANLSDEVRREIVQSARADLSKAYDPFAALNNGRDEYCSKLIWESYNNAGITLCVPTRRWIFPDDLAHSRAFVQFGSWGK
jgi:hypothetical protein